MPPLPCNHPPIAAGKSKHILLSSLPGERAGRNKEKEVSPMTEGSKKCSHCKGIGICHVCKGTGRLGLQKGKSCTSCFPHGSGKCANCRGLGILDRSGHPTAPPPAETQ